MWRFVAEHTDRLIKRLIAILPVHELVDDLLCNFGRDFRSYFSAFARRSFGHHLLDGADFGQRRADNIAKRLAD